MNDGVGIEAVNAFFSRGVVTVEDIFSWRKLERSRFSNLMMERRSVALPCEDILTNAVNAAKPLIDEIDEYEHANIESIITATESGIDLGKSLSTSVHKYLNIIQGRHLIVQYYKIYMMRDKCI